MHVAMWSGPRNLSTALMYSFGARSDFYVLDEPFYGAYLKKSGALHPMRDEIVADMQCDPTRVPDGFTAPKGRNLYSKQMTHHMLDGFPTAWFSEARHVFLIRHPARVVASYSAKREKPTLSDLGFMQQVQVFDQVQALGCAPLVVDSGNILRNPRGVLRCLCERLGLGWDENMLRWPTGGHKSDGIWARHWYGAVHKSTGFSGSENAVPDLEPWQQNLVKTAFPAYERLKTSEYAL